MGFRGAMLHSLALSRHFYASISCSLVLRVIRPLFSEVAALCGTEGLRMVDMALFSYGSRIPLFSKVPNTKLLRPRL